jgi:hypothetical protein
MPERDLEAEINAMNRRMDDMLWQSMAGVTTSTTPDAAPSLTLETLLEVELWALTGKTWKVSALVPEDGYYRLPACPPDTESKWYACHPKAAEKAIATLRPVSAPAGGGEGE